MKLWRKKQSELVDLFRKDAIYDVFTEDQIKNFPKTVNAIYNYAWDHGHSAGLYEVYLILSDISNILGFVGEDIKNTE